MSYLCKVSEFHGRGINSISVSNCYACICSVKYGVLDGQGWQDDVKNYTWYFMPVTIFVFNR